MKQDSDKSKDASVSLFAATVSATIRMVVPVIGLFMLGLLFDFLLQQEAFYAMVGAGVGALIAIALIYFQIKKIKLKGQDPLVGDPDGIIKPKKAQPKIAEPKVTKSKTSKSAKTAKKTKKKK